MSAVRGWYPARRLSRAAALLLILSIPASVGSAQMSPGVAAGGSGLADYEQRYVELRDLGPLDQKVAPVSGLVLTRDAGRLTFKEGRFYLLAPVGGRIVGAVFVGRGTFSFSPPSGIEQERTPTARSVVSGRRT